MRKILIGLALLLLTGCVSLTPDGRIDVTKSRRQTENACSFAFLRAMPLVGSVVGAYVCTFGLDATFPDVEEAPVKPIKKKPKAKPAPVVEEEDE